ncbi:class F sortase [Spirillospora sp. NBC_01491]|uniref:class F sortase n=1 Tax=Spirillospora sp. NBC_01491 TaxID=2976007 RepID=UPI002E31BC30|nr:class F sortase [Spirillospora sp. NBC_01491]
MGESNREYLLAAGLAVLGALAMGQGMRSPDPGPRYRDLGGPSALWTVPDGDALPPSPPMRIRIPDIGLDAATMNLGQNDDGTVQVPPFARAGLAGWYERGPAPGARGSSVLLGHYDDREGPAVFYRLRELKPGATVRVTRRDRRTAVFRVDATERVRKREFPRGRVYGEVRYAGLRLVTCGGAYDRDERSYRDNVIVYAHLIGGR